jgi:hypothetical protein
MSWYSKSKENIAITPAMARERVDANREAVLAGKHRQRPVADGNKRRLKAAMIAGGFINNGDPIIFDENGYILEGQHRLEACAESGVTITVNIVVRPSVVNGIRTIETFGGKPREMGIKLMLADGIKNYKRAAAVANMLSYIGSQRTDTLDIGQTREILTLFAPEFEAVEEASSFGQKELRSWFLGPVIWAAKIDRIRAVEFARLYTTMENVPKGHPTLALRVWVSNRPGLGGYAGRGELVNVVCSALRNHFEGLKITKIQAATTAHDWLLTQTKSLTRKVNEIITPPQLLKLAA